MTNSNDKTPATCFSSVLRRLLCAGGLPTHPSSDTDNPEPQTRQLATTNLSIKHQPTIPPSIVARLMGLDSIPNNSSHHHHTTIMRKSKSVGSINFLSNFEIPKNPHHQRALSFRESPTFLQTSHMNLTPIEEEKSKNIKISQRKSLRSKSEERVSRKLVIDDGFQEEKKKKWKSRKRSYKYNHPLPKVEKHERKVKKKVVLKRRESEYSEEFCINVLMEVCRLTMDEVNGSVWVVDNLQDISYEIGQEILQVLVYEMIDELINDLM